MRIFKKNVEFNSVVVVLSSALLNCGSKNAGIFLLEGEVNSLQ